MDIIFHGIDMRTKKEKEKELYYDSFLLSNIEISIVMKNKMFNKGIIKDFLTTRLDKEEIYIFTEYINKINTDSFYVIGYQTNLNAQSKSIKDIKNPDDIGILVLIDSKSFIQYTTKNVYSFYKSEDDETETDLPNKANCRIGYNYIFTNKDYIAFGNPIPMNLIPGTFKNNPNLCELIVTSMEHINLDSD